MSNGKVAEYDTPINLLRNQNTLFYSMCERSGDLPVILAMAQEKERIQ